jgi:hypothetical protein
LKIPLLCNYSVTLAISIAFIVTAAPIIESLAAARQHMLNIVDLTSLSWSLIYIDSLALHILTQYAVTDHVHVMMIGFPGFKFESRKLAVRY